MDDRKAISPTKSQVVFKTNQQRDKIINRYIVVIALILFLIIPMIIYPIMFSPFSLGEPITMPYICKYIESNHYWLITYEGGRDLLLNLSVGTIYTLIVSLFSVLSFCIFGIIWGLILGLNSDDRWIYIICGRLFFRPLQSIQMWVILFIIALFVNKWIRSSFHHSIIMFLIFGLLCSPQLGSILKEKIRSLRNEEFIDAAQASGISKFRLIFVHILYYESSGLILIKLLDNYTTALMFELTITYFGIGFRGDTTSLGFVLKSLIYGPSKGFAFIPLVLSVLLIILFKNFTNYLRDVIYE